MANSPRSPRSGSSGPSRTQRRRTRSSARPASAPAKPAAPEAPKPIWQRGLRLTRRAVILGLVVVALMLSFGGSLQIYFNQQHQIAVADQEIRDRKAQIADLEAELARWDDPSYVRAQARERLGWVMPGETGYRVVDDNGNPIGSGVVLQSEQRPVADAESQYWWQRLAGSVSTADSPRRQVAHR